MDLKSLGFRTEMIFHRFDGVVEDRGSYLVVRTPSNPGFMFGNFLMFFEAPREGSLQNWKNIFRQEFAVDPRVKHFTFLWDAPSQGAGDVREFENEKFKLDFSVVLTARSVHKPAKYNSEIVVRPVSSDADWLAVTENQILLNGEHEPASFRPFKEKQMARYRAMSEQGLGHWFGAYFGGVLAGDLGLFREGDIGRFQSVITHADHQRKGVCSTLVYESAKFAFEQMHLKELVMVADENYHAAKIYESVGFVPVGNEYSAFWWHKIGVLSV